MVPNNRDDSADYGVWPSVLGFAAALFVFGLMFGLATGFA